MAATNPSSPPDRDDRTSDRPILVSSQTYTGRRSRWFWLFIGVVAIAVVGTIGYLLLYSGGGGSGGGGGVGYFVLALSADHGRRLVESFRRRH